MKNARPLLVLVALLTACAGPAPTPTPIALPTQRRPTQSPAPTSTLAPTPLPFLLGCVGGAQTLSFREGPGTDFRVTDGLDRGTCFRAYGISQDSLWLLVLWEGQGGWVSAAYVALQGDPAILPVLGADAAALLASATNLGFPAVETIIPSVTLTTVETSTPTPSRTPTRTPSPTPSQTPTRTPGLTPSRTPSRTPTHLATPTPTLPVLPTAPSLLCSEALVYAGQTITCQIPVAHCSYEPELTGSPTYCTDAPLPNYNFTLVVWGQDWSELDGSCLLVSGEVSIFAGKPQIVAASEDQVAICP